MKFYSTLLAIPVMAASVMPSLASFKDNPPQNIVVAEQITLSAEKVNSPTEPEPHRGQGRR
ncbi:hypothetical protein [Nostoc sp. 'Peltigera membranacea cyanobiont' 232]|uniref:hypothetical protein n=1 Tax=Nostoc sp. 'Peltigera membranacea cyanobiont' 232 TaxID=2014531 RepID=UPI000B957784|nr:hypothetical protein [Nostoc sp. 'Peltigera membranacea cyanobiont' 232]OYE00364.1 hypothetical protein CDG79_35535 [Nostoc sp. 'Peltigera membranacea cyanobiont' 232]